MVVNVGGIQGVCVQELLIVTSECLKCPPYALPVLNPELRKAWRQH